MNLSLDHCEFGWDGGAEWIDIDKPLPAPIYPDGLERLLRRIPLVV